MGDDYGDSSVQTTNLAMASVDQTRAECSVLVSTMKEISEKVRAETELRKPLIQKVPEPLRSIENGAEYFNPIIVAIGPYHRGDPQVQPMEEIKKAAARDFCNSTSHSVEEFYAKVGEVAGEARSWYADRFDDMISEKEFTDMMFFDGCFLLEFIACHTTGDPLPSSFLTTWMTASRVLLIIRDLTLFENQIPWVVLEALVSLKPVRINRFVQDIYPAIDVDYTLRGDEGDEGEGSGYKPCHLLDLLRDRYLGPEIKQEYKMVPGFSLFSSATDLAEVGVRIRASKTNGFRDISFHRDLLFGWLSLPPIVIDDLTQVFITNMLAFEKCSVGDSGYDVNSYLCLLAILMSGKEDVKELRSKRIVCSDLSDRRTLGFFESLYPHLLGGDKYGYVLLRLNDYYRNRRVRVVLHRFIYNNFKLILAATSAVIFFVTILQTIFTVYPRK